MVFVFQSRILLPGTENNAYSAQEKALSRACKEPATKGFGGFGSLAIHQPTGILTAFNPFFFMNLKSSSTMYVFQCS